MEDQEAKPIEELLEQVVRMLYPLPKQRTKRDIVLRWFCWPYDKERTYKSLSELCGITLQYCEQVAKAFAQDVSTQPFQGNRLTESISKIREHLALLGCFIPHNRFVMDLADAGISQNPLLFQGMLDLSASLDCRFPAQVVASPSGRTKFIVPDGFRASAAFGQIRKDNAVKVLVVSACVTN